MQLEVRNQHIQPLRTNLPLRHSLFPYRNFSLGIGLACAKALLEAGATICLLTRQSTIPPDLLSLSQSFSREIKTVQCDLSTLTASEAQKVIADAEQQLGSPIDILVNCGGIQRRAKAVEFPEDDWNEVCLQISAYDIKNPK